MTVFDGIDWAISFDEIGLASARHHGVLLRSAFQFVFARRDGVLHAVAAESFLRPFQDGEPMPPQPFFEALDASERLFVEGVSMALHLANHRHVSVGGLDHVLNLGAAGRIRGDTAMLIARHMATRTDEPGDKPSRLICSVSDGAGLADRSLMRDLERLGVDVALRGGRGAEPPLYTIRRFAPAIVRIDGVWFRRVAHSASALRLVAALFDGIKGQGTQVLVEGIETRSQLAAALNVGADLLQGYVLSRPQLAGTAGEDGAIPLAELLLDEPAAIPLHRIR